MLKTLKRTTLALLITLAVCVSLILMNPQSLKNSYTAYADPEPAVLTEEKTAEEAGSLVQDAIEALFANEEGVVEIANIFKGVFSGIGMVNSGISFLKLTGIMKDATAQALANIQRQLNTISDRLAIMDAKLDTIIKKMEEMHAEQDFINRTNAARDYRQYYRDFKTDYVTNGMKPYITQFEGMQINSIKNWYNAENITDRIGDIDNSEIILIYDLKDDKFEVRFTTKNDIPTEETSKYIKFSSDFFPLKADVTSWDANNFRKAITDYIKDKINTIPNELVFSANFEEITNENINQIVEDLVNLLIFRTTATMINQDVNYPLAVIDAFENYAENLNQSETGFDSIIKALYYTHAFEYEVSDIINELCREFIVETAYYGSFVKDILAMSNDILDEKKIEFDNTYCKTITKLENTRTKALTGKPNYCYVTNTVLFYGFVDMTASGKIQYYKKGGTTGYMGSSGKGFSVTIKRFDENSNKVGTYAKNQMIGRLAGSIISMTLRSNGILADHKYLAEKLSGAKSAQDTGVILVDMSGEKDLPFDSTAPLRVKKVIGDYFTDNSDVSLRYLPSKTSTDYVTWHKKIDGSTLDFATGELAVDATIVGVAIYGESHWFWNTDESVFMSGTKSNVVSRNYSTRNTTHKDAEKQIYISEFDYATSFNCILQEALAPKLSEDTDGVNPLYEYRVNNNYIEPQGAEAIQEPTEYETVVKEDPQEAIDKAILMIPPLLIAIIVISSVIVALIITTIVLYIILCVRKNKKNGKEEKIE